MTRGVMVAWLCAGVAAFAIVAALFWPLDAWVAPLPAAGASVASPSAVPAAPLDRTATSDARERSVRKPNQTPAAVASAAPPRRSNPAPVPVPVEKSLSPSPVPPSGGNTGDGNGNDGDRGRPDFGEFFPDG